MSKKVIAIANQKGGVGKTTTVVNLAANLVKEGYKVLCIDFDAQGNLSDYLGYDDGEYVITDILKAEMSKKLTDEDIEGVIKHSKSDGIDYIPSDISLSTADMFMATAIRRETVLKKVLAHKCFDKYDYVLIDCLPSLGILVINALVACDGVIIPVQAQKFAFLGIIQFEEVIELARELNPDLQLYGVLETMCDNSNMTKAVDEALLQTYNSKVFNTRISKSVKASNSTAEQKALSDRTKLGSQYAEFTKELLSRLQSENAMELDGIEQGDDE